MDWDPARYRLDLGGQCTVGLRATPAAASWLAAHAAVLGLAPCAAVAADVWFEFLRPGPAGLPPQPVWAGGQDGDRLYHMAFWEDHASGRIAARVDAEPDPDATLYNHWAAMQPLYRAALHGGGLPLHAALAVWRGRAVAFAAPGGTGKSTTLRRLPSTWEKLGDDEMIAMPGPAGAWRAQPMPTWSNFLLDRQPRRWRCEDHRPLGAVVFLVHADRDRLERLDPGRAAVLVHQSARQILRRGWTGNGPAAAPVLKARALDAAVRLAASVPAYLLHQSREGAFWPLVEAALTGAVPATAAVAT